MDIGLIMCANINLYIVTLHKSHVKKTGVFTEHKI